MADLDSQNLVTFLLMPSRHRASAASAGQVSGHPQGSVATENLFVNRQT
ncbi:hypothetical protein [Plantactinospora soyae]|uniref:Uncharacterized protein n=1 Tax=Plantactinospora soyae TaxID=1544732 RepID=A0A927M5D2_9ACTN|nr:hypothetical protein [Plantactinospora soyae]MBE1488289.1 hypothetical protein [Plantactinospora soyae]